MPGELRFFASLRPSLVSFQNQSAQALAERAEFALKTSLLRSAFCRFLIDMGLICGSDAYRILIKTES
jgi:hypothetical protein